MRIRPRLIYCAFFAFATHRETLCSKRGWYVASFRDHHLNVFHDWFTAYNALSSIPRGLKDDGTISEQSP
jgi:hypothetical protein